MRLLFIAGAGRSGSTLLERVLARFDGVTALGEVTHLWERGIRQNQLCGCGRPFAECDLWKRILHAAFGDELPRPPDILVHLRNQAVSPAGLMRLASTRLQSHKGRQARREYQAVLGAVYRAAAKVTYADVVIDSSKYPTDAFLVRDMRPDIQLHLLHLVRDSNAVVYSWQRRKRRPEIHWKRENMPRHPWWKTAFAWSLYNLALERLGADPEVQYLRIRYEDLVRDPAGVVAAVTRFVGLSERATPFIDGSRVSLGTDHTVSGNPSRFAHGTVRVLADNEWLVGAPALQKLAVNAITAFHRRKYGYAGGSRAGGSALAGPTHDAFQA